MATNKNDDLDEEQDRGGFTKEHSTCSTRALPPSVPLIRWKGSLQKEMIRERGEGGFGRGKSEGWDMAVDVVLRIRSSAHQCCRCRVVGVRGGVRFLAATNWSFFNGLTNQPIGSAAVKGSAAGPRRGLVVLLLAVPADGAGASTQLHSFLRVCPRPAT